VTTGALARRLGTADAVILGLGAMVGAGVFAAWAPAAHAAGSALLLALGVAAVVAYCNAAASAQLAAVYPTSGGTYVYGRERLGHWWGFAAGWAFVVGKTASIAAMALTVGTYAFPDQWMAQRLVALAAVVAFAALNYRGVHKTAALTRILIALTGLALALTVAAIWLSGRATTSHLAGWTTPAHGLHGLLQAAALLFFAFAGYARIATMAEEVRDPATAIPRAIIGALLVALVTYAVVGASALAAAGPDALGHAGAPLTTAVRAVGASWAVPVTRVGAAIAGLGALLALIAGVGRTTLAMARNHDLPQWLAAVHPRFRTPHRAEAALAALVATVVLITDLRGAIGFSSFGVLLYYGSANAAAFTQTGAERRWPRALNVLGLLGCLVLALSLPARSMLAGAAVLAAGLAGRLAVLATRR
jgi:basic amino acid/polyamine antiporter, APA family